MAVNADDIKGQLLSAVENDSLVLPTLPEIALEVREAANDPNTNIPALAAVPNAHLGHTRDSEEVNYVDIVIVAQRKVTITRQLVMKS